MYLSFQSSSKIKNSRILIGRLSITGSHIYIWETKQYTADLICLLFVWQVQYRGLALHPKEITIEVYNIASSTASRGSRVLFTWLQSVSKDIRIHLSIDRLRAAREAARVHLFACCRYRSSLGKIAQSDQLHTFVVAGLKNLLCLPRHTGQSHPRKFWLTYGSAVHFWAFNVYFSEVKLPRTRKIKFTKKSKMFCFYPFMLWTHFLLRKQNCLNRCSLFF